MGAFLEEGVRVLPVVDDSEDAANLHYLTYNQAPQVVCLFEAPANTRCSS